MKKIFFQVLVAVTILTFSGSSLAEATNSLFSESNIAALKKDPAAFFSKTNTCHFKHILAPKDYKLFDESMSRVSSVDDSEDFVSISGAVGGLYTIFEGFIRLSKTGKIWLAYLYLNEVHYFTNDAASLKQPPQVMLDWSKRFQNAKWVSSLITITPDNCN